MNPRSSTEYGAGHLQNLWLRHKDVIHRLYIIENKTLSQVKHVMESVHKFPALRLHDYEIALREVLKLRKNLKKDDWYTIGVHICNRKKQGKDSEVLWNNRPLTAKKVRKEVLRIRKPSEFYPRRGTAELPIDMIIRTPPGSPSGEVFVVARPAPPHPSQGGVRIALRGTGHVDASRFRHLRENIPFNRFMSELLEFAKSYPLFITLQFPAEWTWTPGPQLFGGNPSLDILARISFQLSNNLWIDWRSDDYAWFLKWLGVSADFMMLRKFFSVKTPTVCAVYETLCKEVRMLKTPAPARVLFEIRDTMSDNNAMVADEAPFLQTAVEIGSRADGMHDVAKRALTYGALSPQCTPVTRLRHLQSLFMIAAAQGDELMMKLLVGAVTNSDDTTEFKGDAAIRLVSLIMHRIYNWRRDEKDYAHIYIQLLVQCGILSQRRSPGCCCDRRPKVAVRNPQSLTIDELVMICPPVKRRSLYDHLVRWRNDYRSITSVAGIFTASLGGVHSLLAYLRSCEDNDSVETRVIMQESLLFAASLNDTDTISALLQLGVDPEVSLLSNNREQYLRGDIPWNPMVVAAAAGNLETLDLLRDKANLRLFLKSAPIHEVVHLENGQTKYWRPMAGRELRRLENLRRYYLHSQAQNSDTDSAEDTVRFHPFESNDFGFATPAMNMQEPRFFLVEKRRFETIAWIRTLAHGIGDKIDQEIIEAAVRTNDYEANTNVFHPAYHPCDMLLLEGLVDANLEYHEGDMDLLQLSIRAQCSLKVIQFLLSKGLRVHSRAATQSGNTMLHDALLGRSRDRSQIVHLLLREGADYKHCGEGLTILEAALKGRILESAPGQSLQAHLDIFTHLFEAGAPVRNQHRPHRKEWQPLLSLLMVAKAKDDLILRVLDAGAEVNARAGSFVLAPGFTPLEHAIFDRRETLARELIRRGANVHARPEGTSFCSTALQAACSCGCSLQFMEYLIVVHRADVNEAPGKMHGLTPLQWAVFHGSLSVTEFLLNHGADVNALSARQPSSHHRPLRALDFAVDCGRLDMVEFLLKAGGRSSLSGLGGAIDIARENRRFAILAVLLDWEREHGSKIIKEEAEWQEQNAKSARLLLESRSDDDFWSDASSDSNDSVGGDDGQEHR